ncbi:MAG: hypothetical protein LQ345_003511 [Seirophora villosa]|nr:MAG: hypothetical protein LQ345_003511 [Seirophora villosa]
MPQPSPSSAPGVNDLSSLGQGSYVCLHKTSFPRPQAWKSFGELQQISKASLGSGSSDILKAIQSFDTSPTQDLNTEQFRTLILAMVVQESGGIGNVVGDDGKSYGLLQVQLSDEAKKHEKPATCDPSGCTYNNYLKMLQQGVYGHSGTGNPIPPGIAYWLRQNSPGAALRGYNTGSVPDQSDYQVASPISTESYVSDIGNRLGGLRPQEFPDQSWKLKNCGFQLPGTS